jgi:hypothetical protein
VHQNRVLTRICDLNREIVAGGWRKLHNLCSSPNKSMEDEIGDTCSMHRRDEKCIQNFIQKALREEIPWET